MDTRATELSETDATKLLIRRLLAADLHTSMPGTIVAFDSTTQVARVQLATRRVITIDGVQRTEPYPVLKNVPLVTPYSNSTGFSITLPVASGDNVLVVFSERSIDAWHDGSGDIPVEPTAPRHHDISDGLCLLGAIPLPNAIPSYRTNGIDIRNRDASVRVTVLNDAVQLTAGVSSAILNTDGTITFNAPAGTTHTGNVLINGSITWTGTAQGSGGPAQFSGGLTNTGGTIDTDGNITADGDVTAGSVSLNSHVHGGVTTGGDNTEGPS